MLRFSKFLFITCVILACAITTGLASSNWVTMDEKPAVIYQIDSETVQFSGEDSDKQLEVWMKSLEKDGSGSYMLARYLVKENGLSFILKERTMYSATGSVITSFQNTTDKWNATTPSSPIGSIATRLFAEYHRNPESYNTKTQVNRPEARDVPQVEEKTVELAVDPNEVKKALDDEQIKKGKNIDGTANFYVRDRRGPALFSGITHYVTADFCLSIGANGKNTETLKFSTEDTRAGVHREKGILTIQADGNTWILTPSYSNSSGSTSVNYYYTYKLPNTLIQALTVTKNPVTMKWMHGYNNSWEDHERIIPDKTLHTIQLMYLGCKSLAL